MFGAWPFRFHLAGDGLEVRLGGWTVRRVHYHDIEEVRPGAALWCEKWTNLLPMSFLTVRRKTGFIRNLVINPPEPGRFRQDLLGRMGR